MQPDQPEQQTQQQEEEKAVGRDMEVEVGAEAGAPYYEFLEGGTVKMEPRPSLGPAVDKHRDEILSNVGEAVVEIIKRGIDKGIA